MKKTIIKVTPALNIIPQLTICGGKQCVNVNNSSIIRCKIIIFALILIGVFGGGIKVIQAEPVVTNGSGRLNISIGSDQEGYFMTLNPDYTVKSMGVDLHRTTLEYTTPMNSSTPVSTGVIIRLDSVGEYNIKVVWERGQNSLTDAGAVTVSKEDVNRKPSITVNNTAEVITGNNRVQIKGTVTDTDKQSLIISATINGIKKTQTIQGPAVNKPFTLVWEIAEVRDGTYSNIPITISDGIHITTVTHTNSIVVDRSNPKLNINISK